MLKIFKEEKYGQYYVSRSEDIEEDDNIIRGFFIKIENDHLSDAVEKKIPLKLIDKTTPLGNENLREVQNGMLGLSLFDRFAKTNKIYQIYKAIEREVKSEEEKTLTKLYAKLIMSEFKNEEVVRKMIEDIEKPT